MTPDPYPDLAGAEPHDASEPHDTAEHGGAPAVRAELDEADSRLLDALSQAGPAVVTAVEDEPRGAFAERTRPSRGRSPLAPVFREPTG